MIDKLEILVLFSIAIFIILTLKYCNNKEINCVSINAMVTQCYDSKGERK